MYSLYIINYFVIVIVIIHVTKKPHKERENISDPGGIQTKPSFGTDLLLQLGSCPGVRDFFVFFVWVHYFVFWK